MRVSGILEAHTSIASILVRKSINLCAISKPWTQSRTRVQCLRNWRYYDIVGPIGSIRHPSQSSRSLHCRCGTNQLLWATDMDVKANHSTRASRVVCVVLSMKQLHSEWSLLSICSYKRYYASNDNRGTFFVATAPKASVFDRWELSFCHETAEKSASTRYKHVFLSRYNEMTHTSPHETHAGYQSAVLMNNLVELYFYTDVFCS